MYILAKFNTHLRSSNRFHNSILFQYFQYRVGTLGEIILHHFGLFSAFSPFYFARMFDLFHCTCRLLTSFSTSLQKK